MLRWMGDGWLGLGGGFVRGDLVVEVGVRRELDFVDLTG